MWSSCGPTHKDLVISCLGLQCPLGWSLCLVSLHIESMFHNVARVSFEITNPAGFLLSPEQYLYCGIQRPPQCDLVVDSAAYLLC